eukprot:9497664-Pyramimonas_sp.AAC.1
MASTPEAAKTSLAAPRRTSGPNHTSGLAIPMACKWRRNSATHVAGARPPNGGPPAAIAWPHAGSQ